MTLKPTSSFYDTAVSVLIKGGHLDHESMCSLQGGELRELVETFTNPSAESMKRRNTLLANAQAGSLLFDGPGG